MNLWGTFLIPTLTSSVPTCPPRCSNSRPVPGAMPPGRGSALAALPVAIYFEKTCKNKVLFHSFSCKEPFHCTSKGEARSPCLSPQVRLLVSLTAEQAPQQRAREEEPKAQSRIPEGVLARGAWPGWQMSTQWLGRPFLPPLLHNPWPGTHLPWGPQGTLQSPETSAPERVPGTKGSDCH